MIRTRIAHLFRRVVPVVALALLLASAIAPVVLGPRAVAADTPLVDWIRQFGSSGYDHASALAVDSSGIYVVGTKGDQDFLRKYSASGTLLWTRYVEASCVTVGPGGIYVGGGSSVRRYDASGNQIWVRQIEDESYLCWASAISADSKGIFVGGVLSYPISGDLAGHFLRKYDADGNVVWNCYPSLEVEGLELAMSGCSTGIYLAGSVHTISESAEFSVYSYVCKYDANGNMVWYHQIGSAAEEDYAQAISADGTGVYVSLRTYDYESGATGDFVRKYDAAGNEVWTRNIFAEAVCTYGGSIYVAGGDSVRRYDTSGALSWTNEFGGGVSVQSMAISASASGIYVTGDAYGALPGCSSQGGWDVFVVRVTASNAPAVPVLISPADGASTSDSTPYLDWSKVTGSSTVHYRLQVDNNADFSSPVVNKTSVSYSYYTVTTTLAKGTYYWRVRAVDASGRMSDWTDSWSFIITGPAAPQTPTLVSPANGAVITDHTPYLDWSKVTAGSTVHYQLQVSKYASFSSTVVNKTWVSYSYYTVATSLSHGTYYWRVRAVDASGNKSAWSSAWSFRVA